MRNASQEPRNIDEYIAQSPQEVKKNLRVLLRVIRESVAPEKVDKIVSYHMPAFKLHGKKLAYFGAFKDHISFFGSIPEGLKGEFEDFETGKGTIRFPNDKPIPVESIRKLVKARMKLIQAE